MVSFSDRLIDRIVTETRGYPYFLQYYCSFLIDSVPDQEDFDINVLERLRPVLLAELDTSFFAGRFAKLPKLERDALLGMARVGEQVRISEIPWKGNRDSCASSWAGSSRTVSSIVLLPGERSPFRCPCIAISS